MNTQLLIRSMNYPRLSCLWMMSKRSGIIQTKIDLGLKLKLLNEKEQYKEVLELFDKYKEKNIPKFSSLVIIEALKACTHLGELQRGLTIHQLLSSRMNNEVDIQMSLIDLYMQCNEVARAESLFNTSRKKPVEMYVAMMKGYLKSNMADRAIGLFNKVQNPNETVLNLFFNACAQLETKERSDEVKKVVQQIPELYYSYPQVASFLLDLFTKCGDLARAEIVLAKMTKSSGDYAILMNAFSRENMFNRTLELFQQMKRDGVQPDLSNYLHLINALSHIGVYSLSQSMIKEIPPSILADKQIQTSLVVMWDRIGCVKEAKKVFEQIRDPDAAAYQAMISCYDWSGMGAEAVQFYHQLPPDSTNESIHVSVLNACSHAGLIDEAYSIFHSIQNKTSVIYCTMVDCLSRTSLFTEAQTLIDEYESNHSPAISIYMVLLSCVSRKKNSHLAESIYGRMKTRFPEMNEAMTQAAILLADAYVSSDKLGKAPEIKNATHQSNVNEQADLSRTVINNEVFQFEAYDHSHPQSSEIHAEDQKISKEILQYNRQNHVSSVKHSLNQQKVKQLEFWTHSEMLAIAWHFVVDRNTKLIQLAVNIRMCQDCHRAIKLIAAIRQCEIIVRDANRIHHFGTNGQCSCKDHF